MDFTQVFPINLNVFVFTEIRLKPFYLTRFNWGFWSLPKSSYFTQMFPFYPKRY